MNELKKLQAQRTKIDKAINKIKRIEEKRITANAEKYIGTCYKFYNSFGGGERFLSYLKVTKIVSTWTTGNNVSIQVEGIHIDDHKDVLAISKENTNLSMWEENPISKDEFDKVYEKVLSKLK